MLVADQRPLSDQDSWAASRECLVYGLVDPELPRLEEGEPGDDDDHADGEHDPDDRLSQQRRYPARSHGGKALGMGGGSAHPHTNLLSHVVLHFDERGLAWGCRWERSSSIQCCEPARAAGRGRCRRSALMFVMG